MKECDLYPPLKRFLEAQNYEVKGEVHDCDVVARRAGEEPVVVELKLTLNLPVLLQAVERLALTPTVYIGVPASCRVLRRRAAVVKLLRMLGLGLISIVPGRAEGGVAVLLDPGEYRPRVRKARQERLLGEFSLRVGDPNTGGASRRCGIMTVYRQQALRLALFLQDHGPTKAAAAARELGLLQARAILYRNVYGWFERQGLGVYALSPRGASEIPQWIRGTEGVEPGAPPHRITE